MANKLVTGADLGAAGSYSPSGVPVNDDELWFYSGSPDEITDNLDALAAVTLTACHFLQEWTGTVSDYIELGITTVYIGEHYGTGTPGGSPNLRVKVTGAATIHVLDTSTTSSEDYQPPVLVHLNSVDAELNVRKGIVGLGAATPGETAEVAMVRASYVTNMDGDARVMIGPGVGCGGVELTGGRVQAFCALPDITVAAGELVVDGSGALGNVIVSGGRLVSNTTGTTTEVTLSGDGIVDYLRNPANRTVTDIIVEGGTLLIDDPIVVTNGVTVSGRVNLQGRRA